VSGVLGFAGDLTSFVVGLLLSLAFFWFFLSYWLDGAKLIFACVGITFALYAAGALLAPDQALGWRLLVALGFLLLGVVTARIWLRREASKYGAHHG